MSRGLIVALTGGLLTLVSAAPGAQGREYKARWLQLAEPQAAPTEAVERLLGEKGRELAELQARAHDPSEADALRAEVTAMTRELARKGTHGTKASEPPLEGGLHCVEVLAAPQPEASVLGLSLDPSGGRLAVLLADRRLVLLAGGAATWNVARTLSAPAGAFLLRASSDWSRIAVVGIDRVLWVRTSDFETDETELGLWGADGLVLEQGLLLRAGDQSVSLIDANGEASAVVQVSRDVLAMTSRAAGGFWVGLVTDEIVGYGLDGLQYMACRHGGTRPSALLEDAGSRLLLVGDSAGGLYAYEPPKVACRAEVSSQRIRAIEPVRKGSRRWLLLDAGGMVSVVGLTSGHGGMSLRALDRVQCKDSLVAVAACPSAVAFGTANGSVRVARVEDWPAILPGSQ